MSRSSSAGRAGFSLVEVTLALGVSAFCLITLLALLPVGLRENKTSLDQTAASDLANAVAVDLRSAPLETESYTPERSLYSPRFHFTLPGSQTPQVVFVDENGVPLGAPGSDLPAGSSGAVYRITVVGPARTTGSEPQRTASPFSILITWPGQADPNASGWPVHYAGTFETVSYLDQN